MSAAKLLFAGTPDFALASLAALVDHDFAPVAVLTQPDRPAGRGKKLAASPVKRYALEQGLPVLQPATLRDPGVADDLSALQPDLMIVAAYGLLLPQTVLDLPRRGCLNVHASLLPRWRGAAPIQQAILAGDEETGVCLMQMEAGLDTGPVFASRAVAIGANETAGELHDRLALLGGALLVDQLPAILAGECTAVPQDDARATYAGKIRTADARLDWSADAAALQRRVRAYNPVPGAWFEAGGERVKCWSAETLAGTDAAAAGTVLGAGRQGIDVACGQGALRLTELQRPGRRRIRAAEFTAQLDLTGRQLA